MEQYAGSPGRSSDAEPSDRPSNTTRDPYVTVSEVIGTGAEAHRMVRVGDWEMRVEGAEGTDPLIRDLDAAERLGFTRPRNIRNTIERIWPENQRPNCRFTVKRQPVGPGGKGTREFTVREYWLTEAQLLKVCARSETPIAEAVLDEMIRVYMLARRGLLPPSVSAKALAAAEGRIAVLEAAVARETEVRSVLVASLRSEIDVRLSEIVGQQLAGVIGPEVAFERIVKPTETALLDASSSARIRAKLRRSVENRLRARLGFVEKGARWESLPRADLALAIRHLGALLADVPARAAEYHASEAKRTGVAGPLFDQEKAKADAKATKAASARLKAQRPN